ncbi:MAG: hypothetical protein K2X50_07880 [Gammaproteobacteria bacterium]|nr:hypothetical protein [Gammaproteobacteria bacterium]
MKKVSSSSGASAVSNQAKPNLNPLHEKLIVMGDLIKIENDKGSTTLKDFLLSIYAAQKTDFAFIPSFFNDCPVEKTVSGCRVQYQLCTSSGQEEHQNLRRLNYPQTDIILLVFHVNSRESFKNALHKWYPEIKSEMPKVPVVLVGVKDDTIPPSPDSVVLTEEAKNAAQACGMDLFMECSLRDLNSVIAVFNQALNCALLSKDETKKLGVLTYLRDLNTASLKRYREAFSCYFFNTFGLKSFAHQLQHQQNFPGEVKQLIHLTRDAQQCVARQLRPAEWFSMQLSCKALNRAYNSEGFWNWSFAHLNFLDAYTRQHPDFQSYHFHPKRVVVALSKHKRLFKQIFRWGVDPWQIAILMGLLEQVKAVHGEDAKKLQDENGYGVAHYLFLGEHTALGIAWLQSIEFTIEQDPQYLLPALAVITGNKELLQKLVELFGYQLTYTDKNRAFSLLHPAVEFEQLEMILWLTERGIDPVKVSQLGIIPERSNLALIAANKGFWKLFPVLRKLGADPYGTPQHQRLVALAAIRSRNKSLALTLIKLYSLDTLAEKHTENSFFYAAILSGDPEILDFALRSGWGTLSDRYRCEPRPGATPLNKSVYHVAAEAGLLDLIDYIVQQEPAHVSIKDCDGDGNTALFYSAKHGDPIKFRRLLERHFSPQDLLVINHDQETIAHTAARFGHTEFVYQLYLLCQSYKIDVMAFFSRVDNEQNTLLHHAMDGGAVKLAIWLVKVLHFSPTALEFQQQIPLRILANRAILHPAYRIHFENVVKATLQEKLMDVDCLTEFPDHQGETIEDVMLEADTQEFYEVLCEELKAILSTTDAPVLE